MSLRFNVFEYKSWVLGIFRKDRLKLLFGSSTIIRTFLVGSICISLFKFIRQSLVLILLAWLNESSTTTVLLLLLYMAVCKANWRSFIFIFFSYALGFGPNVTPPPFHRGELLDPDRAWPVPFCFQGFLPPPLTSLLVLQEAVPCLFCASWRVRILWIKYFGLESLILSAIDTYWLGLMEPFKSRTSYVICLISVIMNFSCFK